MEGMVENVNGDRKNDGNEEGTITHPSPPPPAVVVVGGDDTATPPPLDTGERALKAPSVTRRSRVGAALG